MDEEELEEIKARAEEVQRLLEQGSHTLQLVVNDVSKLVTEVERLVGEVERLEDELSEAGKCPHGSFYEGRSCVYCFGDGTEEIRECSECRTQVWHRGGKCLRHDTSAPKPYELLKTELQQLRSKIEAVEKECSARVAVAEEGLKVIEASSAVMRDALEYVRARIGSGNIGESIAKIDRALSFPARNKISEQKD